jgi:hypothetical protein
MMFEHEPPRVVVVLSMEIFSSGLFNAVEIDDYTSNAYIDFAWSENRFVLDEWWRNRGIDLKEVFFHNLK